MLRRAKISTRLVLGTAQLGMDYGIANRTGQPNRKSAERILDAAISGGIRMFDTAQGYGRSEEVLAGVLQYLGLLGQAKVLTKLAPHVNCSDTNVVRRAVEQSASLFSSSLHCVMLHREEHLHSWSQGLGETLRGCRDQGMFQAIGVSVYDPPSARQALESEGIDLVQVPGNILDHRHEQAGVMALAASLNKTVMIRSVFLQGALLLDPENLPKRIARFRPQVDSVWRLANQMGVGARDVCLGFVRERWPKCLVVFGAEQPEQVRDNIDAWSVDLPIMDKELLDSIGQDVPVEFIRPDYWEDPDPLVVGPRLQLRPMRPSDARGAYAVWMNDPEVTRFLECRFQRYGQRDLEQYILQQRNDPLVFFMAIEESYSSRHIGNLKIGPRVPVHETAEMGLLIGDSSCWGKGYATEAIALATEYAFTRLSIRKLTAGSYLENEASIHAFLKNGFVRECILKEHVTDQGVASDVALFRLLRSEWESGLSTKNREHMV